MRDLGYCGWVVYGVPRMLWEEDQEYIAKQIAGLTPTHEEFRELIKDHQPPDSYYEGEMERPW
jgi:hypothetical protein